MMEQPVAEALVEILKANATIAGLVGDRIFDARPQQGFASPYVVFKGPATDWDSQAGGFSVRRGSTEVELQCTARRPGDVRRLATLVRKAVGNHKGEHPGVKISGVVIARQEAGDYVPSPAGQEGGTYSVTLYGRLEFMLLD